jgi:K+-sensing histidine kinase KdpD
MFTNMARRSQSLVDRQIKLIDDLERAEDDPDTLASLFKLDHLATRMRRNAENLLVLSGTEPTRRWGRPVGLVRVVRAAIAEVEDYTRVELLGIENLPVAGRCVGDAVHLLAELIENATSFSPPNTTVRIAGEAAARGYVLEIEDCGVGMSDAELLAANQRLANPPVIELALDRMLGFFVVGRLAQRHGLKVELRHSWYGGVTALVMLPEQVLVLDAAAQRTSRDVGPPQRAGRQAPGVLPGRRALAREPWTAHGATPPHGQASLPPRDGLPRPPAAGADPR